MTSGGLRVRARLDFSNRRCMKQAMSGTVFSSEQHQHGMHRKLLAGQGDLVVL